MDKRAKLPLIHRSLALWRIHFCIIFIRKIRTYDNYAQKYHYFANLKFFKYFKYLLYLLYLLYFPPLPHLT